MERTLVLERMRLLCDKSQMECGVPGQEDCAPELRDRKNTGQDFPGGGSHCAMQCQAEGQRYRNVQDEKAIEVLALGFPLHHGTQLA